MTTGTERRALIALFRNHPDTTPNERYGWGTPMLAAERREALLRWTATLSDYQLLSMRNFGRVSLAWVRQAAQAAEGHHAHRYECSCGATVTHDALLAARRWVASIGARNLDTGRRITKADALLAIDVALSIES